MKKIRTVLLVTIAFFMFIDLRYFAYAESLPSGLVIADSEGNQVTQTGDYYIEENDVKPEYQFKKTIIISNLGKDDRSYNIGLRFSDKDEYGNLVEKTGEIDLIKKIKVTVSMDGKVMYEGDATGNGTPTISTTPLSLGVYDPGRIKSIVVEFSMPSEVPGEDWSKVNSADFHLVFHADEISVSSSSSTTDNPLKPKLPLTGDDWRNVIIGIIFGLLLVSFILLVIKKRHENKKED